MAFFIALVNIFVIILCMINNDENIELQEPCPWGIWPTIGFSVVIFIVEMIIQVAVVMAFIIPAVVKDKNLDIKQFAESIETNGFCQSLVTFISAPFVIGLILLFAKIRKGITVKQYLGFNNPGIKSIIKWCLIGIGLIGISDTITYFLDKPIVPEVMVDMYKSSYFPPLLLLDVIIIASVLEELFFRGFLFVGIKNSKIKAAGAIILTSLVWSLLHSQYDVYGIFSIFLSGLLLGYSRVKSNSIYPPIAIHIIFNVVATTELLVYLRYFQS